MGLEARWCAIVLLVTCLQHVIVYAVDGVSSVGPSELPDSNKAQHDLRTKERLLRAAADEYLALTADVALLSIQRGHTEMESAGGGEETDEVSVRSLSAISGSPSPSPKRSPSPSPKRSPSPSPKRSPSPSPKRSPSPSPKRSPSPSPKRSPSPSPKRSPSPSPKLSPPPSPKRSPSPSPKRSPSPSPKRSPSPSPKRSPSPFPKPSPSPSPSPNGPRTYIIYLGSGTMETSLVMTPTDSVVPAGSFVKFISKSPLVHTVTFIEAPDGVDKAALSHSGLPDELFMKAGDSRIVQLTVPGPYYVICLAHYGAGMHANITVVAK